MFILEYITIFLFKFEIIKLNEIKYRNILKIKAFIK